MSRQFAIVVTQENRLRFKLLKKEHGLLHDRKEKKSYAIVRDAYPTNWTGKWSRAYLVYEEHAQTVNVGAPSRNADDTAPVDGSTVEIVQPLSMVAKIRVPGPRGEDGRARDTHLTAESIYDRTLSAQVRRLGNRRIQWFHAILFVSLGVAICLALVAAIALFGSHGGTAATASAPTNINGGAPTGGHPLSTPTPEPVVVVPRASQIPGG